MSSLEEGMARAEREGWAAHVKTEADRRFVAAGGYFDISKVFRVLSILSLLVLGTGRWAGQCFEPMDWQINKVIGPVWGWRWPDGTRRYTKVLVYIPKKNGKTTLCAGLGIILLAFDDEPGAKVFSVARQKSQAAMVWEEARDMILRTPELKGQFVILPTAMRIHHPETGSVWEVLAKGAEDKEGLNASAIVVDELHVIENRKILPTLRFSGAARENFLQLIITTAGEVEEGTIWGDELKYARKVRDGEIIDDAYLPVIFEADITQHDPGSEEAWKAANPSYGEVIRPQEMQQAWTESKDDPEKRAEFLRYRINVAARTSRGSIDLAHWNACNQPVDLEQLRGRACLAAFDLGKRRDMAALWILFAPRSQDDMLWSAIGDFWLPEATLEPTPPGEEDIVDKATRELYRMWKRQGWLETTPGKFTDYRHIRERIVALHRELKFRRVLFDPWDASQMSAELLDLEVPVVEFPQTLKQYAPGCKEFVEVILPSHNFAHGDGDPARGPHPILTWNAQNLQFYKDHQGNRKPDKEASKFKIDGISCVLMTVCQAITMKDLIPKAPSRYARGEGLRGA